MTDDPTEPAPDSAAPEDDDRGPIAPRPAALLAALIIAVVLVYNLTLDAGSDTYEGSKVTYGLVIGLCGVLGFDLSRFWPGNKK